MPHKLEGVLQGVCEDLRDEEDLFGEKELFGTALSVCICQDFLVLLP